MQPYFLPYRPYYGLIRRCDDFVVFDDVQFRRGWQQRNQILRPDGSLDWITVPIVSRRPAMQRICDVRICNEQPWVGHMLARIRSAYSRRPFFQMLYPELDGLLRAGEDRLAALTTRLLQWSAERMGLRLPRWHSSSHLGGVGLGRTERLVHICRLLGAAVYLCGPAAKAYLDASAFQRAAIDVVWHEESYPAYPQFIDAAFQPLVSALDLLMGHGPNAAKYLEPG